ncbi:MAG: CBS domain-containing protein [Chitinophagaceae bacterium]
MIERGFLDVKTFRDVVSARGTQRVIMVEPEQSVAEAVELMKKYDIEHIPIMNGAGPVGAISEGGLFQKIFDNPDIKHARVADVMEPAFPVVSYDTPVEKLSHLINKENGAVLAKDEAGNFHIVTKYDVIQALGK